MALYVLHRVEMHAALAADVIDRDDIRVVKLGSRVSFVLEALKLPGIHRGGEGQDFQGHAPAKRNLLRFVHDPHAAAADFAEDAEIA